MTEQEYIDRGDLVSICHALEILRTINPENSSVVALNRYRQIMALLVDWQDALYKVVKIE